MNKKISLKELTTHETKSHILIKFLAVLSLFVIYFAYIAHKYGIQEGFFATALTWSFFVLCTPIADAGFLIDFPLRILTRIRMLKSETLVWIIAISLNLYAFFFNDSIYQKTSLLKIFKHILEEPFPFWGIIIISMIGTFVSITFGDELLDKVKHKDRKFYHKHKTKHRFLMMIFLATISIVFYNLLLQKLGINL